MAKRLEDNMFTDTVTRLIRTYVPIAIGTLVAQFPFLDGVFNTEIVVALAIATYYTVAAALERVHPFFGYLLGVPKASATTDAYDRPM